MTDEETRAHTAELVAALKVEHARIKRKRDAAPNLLMRLHATNGLLLLLMRTLGGDEQRECGIHYDLNRAVIAEAEGEEK